MCLFQCAGSNILKYYASVVGLIQLYSKFIIGKMGIFWCDLGKTATWWKFNILSV